MTTPLFMHTIIEIVIAGLLIIGFMYEPVIARWEQRQKKKMLRAFKEMRRYRK